MYLLDGISNIKAACSEDIFNPMRHSTTLLISLHSVEGEPHFDDAREIIGHSARLTIQHLRHKLVIPSK